MAEKWRIQDSARTMTNKFNNMVDELNTHSKNTEEKQKKTDESLSHRLTSESINVEIESPSTADLNALLGVKETS